MQGLMMTEARSPIPLRCAPDLVTQRQLITRLQAQLAEADAIARATGRDRTPAAAAAGQGLRRARLIGAALTAC